LHLVWLLDYLRSHPEIVVRFRLRLVDYDLITATAEELGRWQPADVDVTDRELTAGRAPRGRRIVRQLRKPVLTYSTRI
jgi:hypothetical protein